MVDRISGIEHHNPLQPYKFYPYTVLEFTSIGNCISFDSAVLSALRNSKSDV